MMFQVLHIQYLIKLEDETLFRLKLYIKVCNDCLHENVLVGFSTILTKQAVDTKSMSIIFERTQLWLKKIILKSARMQKAVA